MSQKRKLKKLKKHMQTLTVVLVALTQLEKRRLLREASPPPSGEPDKPVTAL